MGKAPSPGYLTEAVSGSYLTFQLPGTEIPVANMSLTKKGGGWADLGNVIVISSFEKLWEYLKIFLDFLKVTYMPKVVHMPRKDLRRP